VAYRADIEIAVKGAQDLKKLTDQINTASKAVDSLNNYIELFSGAETVRNINNLSTAVREAATAFNRAALDTDEAVIAARAYVKATDELNAGLRERLQLVRSIQAAEIAERRVIRPSDAGYGQQTPALPPAFIRAQEIQQNWTTFFKQASELGRDLTAQAFNTSQNWSTFFTEAAEYSRDLVAKGLNTRQTWSTFFTEAAEYSRDLVAKALNTRQTWSTFFTEAAEYSRDLVAKGLNTRRSWDVFFLEAADIAADLKAKSLNTRQSWNKFFADAAELRADIATQDLQRTQRIRGERLQGLALGAGFPLLFGGGPGAVLGGAAGGLVPGKGAFAAQIGFSAIGQQLDKFVAATAEAGVALTSTSKTFDFMREKALFSSTVIEDQAIALEEQGKVTELANLLTKDLAKNIGGEGVEALQKLGDETNKLTKEWNLLTAQLFALVSGPLSQFISILNSFLGGITTERRLAVLRSEATPVQQARLAQITAQERGGETRNVRGGGTAFVAGAETTAVRTRILERAAAEGIVPAAPLGRVTSEDLRGITAPKATKRSDKAARDAAREAERVAEVVRQQQLATLEYKRQEEFGKKIAAAELARDPALVRRLQGEQQLAEWGIKTVNLLEKEENATARLAIARTQQAEQSLIISKTQQDLAKIEADRVEKFQDIITGLERQNELDTIKDERVRALREIEFQILDYKKQGLIVSEAEAQLYRDMAAARIKGPGAKRMEELQTSLASLTNQEQLAVAAADNIGQAFGNAFQEIVTGASSGQEAIANMMKSIGENFINMAAQIIAQQITMIILGTILKALGIGFSSGGGGGGGGGAGVNVTPGGSIDPLPGLAPGIRAANGAYFSNGIAAFAAGGIVNRPTLFKFANGGTTQTGLMGEAGPEAIMPLQRDGSGRLGVNAMGLREAMAGGGMGGGAPVLNMSFETTRFGDTEYVSRDQLEAAMAATRRQAARDGAQRGMTMTLDRIQQSPQTRSRLGMR